MQEAAAVAKREQELTKVNAKEKQDFMENLITTVSPSMIFKTPEATVLADTKEDGGMKELKLKYDTLKATAP